MGWWWTNQESELRVRERCEVGVWGGGGLTKRVS